MSPNQTLSIIPIVIRNKPDIEFLVQKFKLGVIASIKEFLSLTFVSAGMIVLIFWFVGQPLEISGQSMLPTFQDKEQILVEKISIKNTPPKRGEVIIIRHPQNDLVFLIKRVIGLPGETIKIENGLVFINGKQLLEKSYLTENIETIGRTTIKDNQEFQIPEDSYVVLGDNRGDSADSRTWGAITTDRIVGRPILVYYPWENFRLVEQR